MKKKMNSTKKETKAKKIAAKLDEPDMEIFKTFLKDRKIIEDTQENLDKYKAYADYLNENLENSIKYADYGCNESCYAPGGHAHSPIIYADYQSINEPYRYEDTTEYKNSNSGLLQDISNTAIANNHEDLIEQLKRAKQWNETVVNEICLKHEIYDKEFKSHKKWK